MVELEIDGKKVEVPPGTMLIEAANKLGTYIPHFCYHKKLSIAASCRMCLVEVEKAPKPLPACATPVSAGMIVRTSSEKAISAQKAVMEFLLINHPLDCPICDQGGECQLQDLAVGYGATGSRYREEKRVVFVKTGGPLVSMQEMSRCIHCTRCVRFGQEVAGVMELGMLNRGEHAEITTFVGKTIDSELSGNMIDLCPVGALTSKPFRYTARNWELSRRKSVSPHDSLGANIIVQVKNNKVMRVLPLENEAINECWITDKDRFSYEGLNCEERLTKPMVKQGGQWRETDWQTALEYVAHGLKNIKNEHGADAIAALATPYSTLEELSLLQKLIRGLGSDNVDFRLRQTDLALDGQVAPWLGLPITDFAHLTQYFVIGSFFRKDHPLLAARIRHAVKMGAKLNILHASDDDLLIPVANKVIVAPSAWLAALGEVIAAVAKAKEIAPPAGYENIQPSAQAEKIAANLMADGSGVFLGNAAMQHPQAAQLHLAAQWIAQHTNAKFGHLIEAGNTVGGYLAQALPSKPLSTALQTFAQARKAYVLLNTEPLLDCANPQAARAALEGAEMVIALSAYKHSLDHADVLLPIAPFTETSGTFVNCEGRAQSFNGVVKALGEARPGWKVLRVLGNLLGLAGFDYETSEAIRNEVLGSSDTGDMSARLNNLAAATLLAPSQASTGIERVADVPIYFTDGIARRAKALQKTNDAKEPKVRIAKALFEKLGIAAGDMVKVQQGASHVILAAVCDSGLPDNVVKLSAGHTATSALGAMFGSITVERV